MAMRDQDLFLERALLDAGVVDDEKLSSVRRFATEHSVDLVDALVQSETVDARDLAVLRADVCEVPYVDLGRFEPCFANTSLLPRTVAETHMVFPLFKLDGVLTVAMDDPLNLEATDIVRQASRYEVDAVLSEREQLRALVTRAYSLGQHKRADDDTIHIELDENANADKVSSQPAVAAVNQMLIDAIEERASDIHLNPDEHELHLRYRVDGVLHQRQGPPLSMHPSLVQRLKVMGNLDITQTRRPQDGKFRFRHGSMQVDVRMSTVPTVCGENVVLRLLTSSRAIQGFRELGVPSEVALDLEDMLAQPYGMLLVTGPTGSGKTTTLYTAISKLNDPSRNIMTIEDPVEIRLPYVRQIQVNSEIGMTFAGALRSVLRQDPDVVLVGEVRDNETAHIALQAALTGHLVLSTLHTNDAVGAIARLRDYGLPPFVLNSAVLGVLAQRLVRRICRRCTRQDDLNDIVRQRFGITDEMAPEFKRGKGCTKCSHTGYSGRVGIYELLRMRNEVRHLIEDGVSAECLRQHAVQHGMELMWQDGMKKARLGHTTLEEVAKVATVMELSGRGEPDEERESA